MPRAALLQLDYTGCLALMGRKGFEKEAGRLGRDLARRRAVV